MSDTPPPDTEARTAPSARSRLLGLARRLYLVALAVGVAWLVWTRREALAELVAGTRPGWLAAAFLLALGQLTPSVLLWTVAARRLDGTRVPVRAVAEATALSVPTRYLPGSVWYALGRATVLRRDHGISRRTLGATAALESILAVVVAIAGGSALLALVGRFPARPGFLAIWFVGLAAVGSPPVVNALLGWVARRRGAAGIRLDWATYARLVAITVAHWTWSATTFTVYLRAFPGLGDVPALEVAGSFLTGWVVGFLAVFAPQGLGAFEGAVAALLVGSGIASVAVVVGGYRAMMVVRDAAVFGLAQLARRRG